MLIEHGPLPPGTVSAFTVRRDGIRSRNLELADSIQDNSLSARQLRAQTTEAVFNTVGLYTNVLDSVIHPCSSDDDTAAMTPQMRELVCIAGGLFAGIDLGPLHVANAGLVQKGFQDLYLSHVDLTIGTLDVALPVLKRNVFYQTYERLFGDKKSMINKDMSLQAWTQVRDNESLNALVGEPICEVDDILFDYYRANGNIYELGYFPREAAVDTVIDSVIETDESPQISLSVRKRIDLNSKVALTLLSKPSYVAQLGRYRDVAKNHFVGSLLPLADANLARAVRHALTTQDTANQVTELEMQHTGYIDLEEYRDTVQPAWDTVDAELAMQILGRI